MEFILSIRFPANKSFKRQGELDQARWLDNLLKHCKSNYCDKFIFPKSPMPVLAVHFSLSIARINFISAKGFPVPPYDSTDSSGAGKRLFNAPKAKVNTDFSLIFAPYLSCNMTQLF